MGINLSGRQFLSGGLREMLLPPLKPIRHDWNDEMKAFLEEMYATTKKSFAEMTADLNARFGTEFSRNAVIGKINRLGLREKHKSSHHERVTENTRGRRHGSTNKAKKPPVAKKPRALPWVAPAKIAPTTLAPESEVIDLPQFKAADAHFIPEPVPLMELRHDTCRWPLGEVNDHPPYLYCGGKSVAGSPYCRHHGRLARRS